jgi:5S rRNA maturation endonuclease (ribonuclease M5)
LLVNRQRGTPSLNDIERAERLKSVVEALYEINKNIPIIVEGKKDVTALRRLGLVGEIITLHNGKNLYDFCVDIEEKFHRVIILLDWDKKGDNLNKALTENLKGYWEEFSSFREIIKLLCQKDINDIEGIPKLLRRLEGDESPWY